MSRVTLMLVVVGWGLCACDDFATAARNVKCDAGFTSCGTDAGGGGVGGGAGGGAPGGGAGGGGTGGGGADAGLIPTDAGGFVPGDFTAQPDTGSGGAEGVQVVGADSGVVWAWRGSGGSGLVLIANGGSRNEVLLTVHPTSVSTVGDDGLVGGSAGPMNLAVLTGFSSVVQRRYPSDGGGDVVAVGLLPSAIGGSPHALLVRAASNMPPQVEEANLATNEAVWTAPLCRSATVASTVHDGVVLADTGQWVLAVDHCVTFNEMTTLVRVFGDGGVDDSVATNERAVVGAAAGSLWVASAFDGGTLVEERSLADLTPVRTVAFIEGLQPADVVPVQEEDGGLRSLYVVGGSADASVSAGATQVAPPGVAATVVLEFWPNGSLKQHGWLDVGDNQPAMGGAAWANGRLWVTGRCAHDTSTWCPGVNTSAYLFSLGP